LPVCEEPHAWKDIGDRLQVPHYLTRDGHYRKIRARKQRRDVGKFSFVNRTIADWNHVPEGAIGFSYVKIHIFSKRVRKVVTMEGKEREVKCCEAYIWKLFLSKLCYCFLLCMFVLCRSRCCNSNSVSEHPVPFTINYFPGTFPDTFYTDLVYRERTVTPADVDWFLLR
jgi:hypothetical protein